MSDGSSIEWCDATWQPVLGCTRVDFRCDKCYAISVVHRGMSPQHKGLTKLRPKDAARPGVDWNGTVRLQPDKLVEPLRWRKPRRVFVCSLADLFHPKVPFEHIAAVFRIMGATPQHTYLVLTKRPERAREFFAWLDPEPAKMLPRLLSICAGQPWPLGNVHLGVSVSDQATAEADIPALIDCPAVVRWVSYEPALGPVDFTRQGWLCCGAGDRGGPHVDWIVVGGESGPGARPFDIEWARDVVRQCAGTGTRVFVKQLGSCPVEWRTALSRVKLNLNDAKGGDMSEWDADLRVREMP